MQIRRTSNVQNTNAVNLQSQNKTSGTNGATALPTDQIDISAEAQMISQSSDIRADRVADIRTQIASGKYESADKINAAVERMLDEFA